MKFSAMDFIKHYSNLPIGPNLHVVKNHYVNLRGKAQESNTMDWDESVFVPARHQFFNLRKSNIPLYYTCTPVLVALSLFFCWWSSL